MPKHVLPEQTGNSCAAHCTVIAVAELLGTTYCLTKEYAETSWWPQVQFKGGEGPLSEHLKSKQNSDPRRMVEDMKVRWGGLGAAILCCDTDKTRALTYVGDPAERGGLEAMFNMIKDYNVGQGKGTVATIALEDGAYYNGSYLMLDGATAKGGRYTGMHNMLIVSDKGTIWHYNSNETTPAWQKVTDWKVLDGQNGGTTSYVFTGVCIEMRRR